MRHLLLLFAMLIGFSCLGQKKDSVVEIMRIIGSGNQAAIGIGTDNLLYEFTATPKQDTVKVLMLVCDTSRPNTIKKFEDGTIFEKSGNVWWQFGYIVKEKIETDQWVTRAESMIGEFVSYWVTKQYLDKNKKPLQKSIIVWMSKEIK